MSEYQYYEFQAIDRPLTAEQMSQLRRYSSRARITPTSFVVEYNWGDFKGNEDAWMDQYFDAFLYVANWGTHVLKLRLPVYLLDLATAAAYCGAEPASPREHAGHVVISFNADDEPDDDWVEGDGILASLVTVRAELARGDRRALYLGWLRRAQAEDLDDADEEPEVPASHTGPAAANWRIRFFQALAETSNVTASAARVRVPVDSVYKLKRDNPRFAARWLAALHEGYDLLEMELLGYLRNPRPASKMDVSGALRVLAAHREAIERRRAMIDEEEEDEQAMLESLDTFLAQMRQRRFANEAILLEAKTADGAE